MIGRFYPLIIIYGGWSGDKLIRLSETLWELCTLDADCLLAGPLAFDMIHVHQAAMAGIYSAKGKTV